jgi:hypothetical protein
MGSVPDFRQPIHTEPVDTGLDWIRQNFWFINNLVASGVAYLPGWNTIVDVSLTGNYATPDKWILTKGSQVIEVRFTWAGSTKISVQICYNDGVQGGLVCFAPSYFNLDVMLGSLVSWWKLDEASGTRADSHGNNTLTEDAAGVGSATGLINTAALVDRDLSTNDGELFRLGPTSGGSPLTTHGCGGGDRDFTFSIWHYPTTAGSPPIRPVTGIACCGDIGAVGASASRFDWAILADTDEFFFRTSDGSNQTTLTIDNTTVDEWVHLLVYYDSTRGVMGMSINNATATEVAPTNPPQDSGYDFQIGAFGPFEAEGRLDEAAFWTKLLTDAEKTALYRAGAGMTYPG